MCACVCVYVCTNCMVKLNYSQIHYKVLFTYPRLTSKLMVSSSSVKFFYLTPYE